MKILITGAAGFIGSQLVKKMMTLSNTIIGIDNLNPYYDVKLKYARLKDAGINFDPSDDKIIYESSKYPHYKFLKLSITDRSLLEDLFKKENFDIVISLAGQAGVRYSIENPYEYIEDNVIGFLNILENCRHNKIKHLLYASSSSVYGLNTKTPYAESDNTDTPISLYAATKKSDELMAHAYSNLYKIPTTGFRFFTVYGPWGRPDMAPYKFMKSILNGDSIDVYNYGNMSRDFTYIDDVVNGIALAADSKFEEDIPYHIYNIGSSNPIKLMDFISTIEEVSGKKAILNLMEKQPGDMLSTYADASAFDKKFDFKANTSLKDGRRNFHEWYINYYK